MSQRGLRGSHGGWDGRRQMVELSTDDVDSIARMGNESGLLEYIMMFYKSRMFENPIDVEMNGVHVNHASGMAFTDVVNEEWRHLCETSIFQQIVAYGFCVIRYMDKSINTRRRLTRHERYTSRASRKNNDDGGDDSGNDDDNSDERKAASDKHPPKDRDKTGDNPDVSVVADDVEIIVIPMTAVRLLYHQDPIDNEVTFEVYRRGEYFSFGAEDRHQQISNVRVLYVPEALTGNGAVTSLYSRVRIPLLAYERLSIDTSLSFSRIASPDWGIASTESNVSATPEEVMEFESADVNIDLPSSRMRMSRFSDHSRQAALARQAALHVHNTNMYADMSMHRRMQHHRYLRDSNYGESVEPLWMERPGYRLDSNETHFSFPTPSIPSNTVGIMTHYLSRVAMAFSLNASFLLNEMSGNSSTEQVIVGMEQNIKRFSLRYHRLFEQFLLIMFQDLYGGHLETARYERGRNMPVSDNLNSAWHNVNVRFHFRYTDLVRYDELKRIYEDGVIDEETYLQTARNLYSVHAKQRITPSQKRARDFDMQLAQDMKRTKMQAAAAGRDVHDNMQNQQSAIHGSTKNVKK